MSFINIKIDTRQVDKKMNQMVNDISDWSKPLGAVGDELIGVFGSESIKTQGTAVGEKWKGLSKATLMARSMRTGYYKNPGKGGSAALIWTGRLRKGFNKKVSSLKVVIANKVPYFKHHQSPRRPGRPPRRPMMGITNKTENGIIKILNNYLAKIVNK